MPGRGKPFKHRRDMQESAKNTVALEVFVQRCVYCSMKV
jgi:hypothetical protein